MAYRIEVSECTVCGTCEFACPNGAIRMKGDYYVINEKKCTECEGKFDAPQCVSQCPADAVMHA